MADRTVAVSLVARMQGYRSGLAEAAKATRQFGGELDGVRKKSANLHDVEVAATAAGAALIGLAGWAVKSAMEFDKQMSEVKAVSGATADQLQSLREAALQAGKDTVFSATESAKAEAELAKAGLSTADILGGALTGSLALAAAGSLDLAEAADVAAKAMSQFGLQGKDVAHVADLLAGGANATATDVHELGMALRMGGGAAHAAGMSFEDTVTVLGALTKGALVGSDAGTSLKTMLMMLAAPTQKSTELMQQLGLSVYDANGRLVDAYTLADRLKQSLGPLTQQQRSAALATIFGADAMRAANTLYEQGADGLHRINTQILAQADASRVAAEKTNNLAGDLERLKGSLESLAIESGEGSTGGLRFIVKSLDHLVSQVSAIPAPVQQAMVVIGGLTGTALLAAVAYGKLRTAVRDATEAMRQSGPAGEKFGGWINTAGKWAGRATIAFGALQVAGALLSTVMNRGAPDVQVMANALQGLAESGEGSAAAVRMFGPGMDRLLDDIKAANQGLANLRAAAGVESMATFGLLDPTVFSWTNAAKLEELTAVDNALAQMVSSGHAEQAAAAFDLLAQKAAAAGIPVEKLRETFPHYAAALDQAQRATNEDADAATKAAQEWDGLKQSMTDAATVAGGLKHVFDDLNGAFETWSGAEINAEDTLAGLKTALDDSNGSINVHTEKGREARRQLLSFAQATRDAMQAKYDETHSVSDAQKVLQHYKDELYKAGRQAGLTEKQARALVEQWLKMPPVVKTTVITDYQTQGTPPGRAFGEHSGVRQPELSGDRSAGPSTVFRHHDFRWGGVVEHAAAGALREASTFDAGARPLYAFAEPQTRGEAFIPKSGDYARSMGILSQAASWYGATVSAGNQAPVINYAQLGRAVAAAMRDVRVVMDGQTLGRIQARQADLLSRGG